MSSDFVADHPDSDEDPFQSQHERLVAVRVRITPESSPDPVKAQPVSPTSARKRGKAKRRKNRPSQGDTFLLSYLAPNHPDIAKAAATTTINGDSGSETESGDSDASMEDIDTRIAKKMEKDEREEKVRLEQLERERRFQEEREKKAREKEVLPREVEEKVEEEEEGEVEEVVEVKERLRAEEAERKAGAEQEEKSQVVDLSTNAVQIAAAALGISAPPLHPKSPATASPEEPRAPSPADEKQNLPPINGLGFQIPAYDRSAGNHANADVLQSPLEVRKLSISNGHHEESLITSPLGVHLKQSDSAGHKLPALQSPGSPDAPTSPQNQKLPGFQQINEIATKANETISRRFSLSAPSPMAYSGGPVRSPHPFNHASPSLYSDTSPRQALSPPSGTSSAFMFSRRPSQASDYPPPLASASTTDSSYASASTDGYSPSTQPTPQSETHRMSLDGTGLAILPPPVPSMQPLTIHTIPAHGSGGFRCDYSGCTAAPFQTQYLLK
jgi:hypothetical protein